MNRGSTAEFTYTVSGRHDNRKLEVQFKSKAKTLPTDAFVFRKRNTLAGGSDAEISTNYNASANTTDITIKLIDDDTRALTVKELYYDVMSTHATNADDVSYPVVNKKLPIQGTITSQLSGLPSGDAINTVIVDASNANVGDVATIIEVAGIKMPSFEPLATSPIKTYRALISQSGTNNPTVTVLENTIGDIAWIKSPIPGENGIFWTVADENTFPANKTVISIGSLLNAGFITVQYMSSANIILSTYNTSWNYANSILSATPIEILVYP